MVCGFLSGVQDNWLITQYINNTARRDMYISVKFSINTQCDQGCGNVLDLYVLETSNADQSFARNVSNFPRTPRAVLTDTVRDGSTLTTVIIRIGTSSTPGLYVAFRDRGTCAFIGEVIVYYLICDAHSPMVRANFSRDGLPGEIISGTCFPNMAVGMNMPGRSFEARCVIDQLMPNASWNTACMCAPGYRFASSSRTDQCEGIS